MAATRMRMSARQQKRRLLFLFFILCLAAALYLRGSLFVVREIEVEGLESVDYAQVVRQSGLELGGSIFKVDREKIRRNMTRLGKVELVEIETRMPDTVVLKVHERKPAAMISYLGVVMLVGEDGCMIQQMDSMGDYDLPVLSGLKISQYQVGRKVASTMEGQVDSALEVLAELRTQSIENQVSELNVQDLDNIYLITRTGLHVKLGDATMLHDKLVWMRGVTAQLQSEGITTGVLDVSSAKAGVYSPF
jgi:cell division protein FtsQ